MPVRGRRKQLYPYRLLYIDLIWSGLKTGWLTHHKSRESEPLLFFWHLSTVSSDFFNRNCGVVRHIPVTGSASHTHKHTPLTCPKWRRTILNVLSVFHFSTAFGSFLDASVDVPSDFTKGPSFQYIYIYISLSDSLSLSVSLSCTLSASISSSVGRKQFET